MTVEELTKKEQIINFAQNDPFLKISDIADYVQTTPRYVRTILSEANISLMKLREKYARSMEKRLQTQDQPDDAQALRMKPISGDLEIGSLLISEILDEEYEDLIKINGEERLWRINQLYYNGAQPFCLKELVTFFADDLNQEKLASLDSVYGLFARKGINRLHFLDNIFQFIKPEDYVRELLKLQRQEPVLVVSRNIRLNKISIGWERTYLRAERVEMRFPGKLIM